MSLGSPKTAKMDRNPVPITVMLVGKTGSGKSLLANTLLNLKGDQGFFFGVAEGHSRGRLTTEPQSYTKVVDGTKLRVIDTPGFFDSEESVNARWLDILKAVSLAGNSLDVIVLVVSIHQIGAGVDCFKIVKNHMLEYIVDRLVIVFTFAGGVDETIRQQYKRQFNEDVQCGTLGASYVFSDQKDGVVPLSRSKSQVLEAIQRIHQTNPTRLEKKSFGRHTETVVRNGLEAMKRKGVITYRMYCEHMKLDEGLLTHFISKDTIDDIFNEYNDKKQTEERRMNDYLGNVRHLILIIVVIVIYIFIFRE